MSFLNFLKPAKRNPFSSQDYYDRDGRELTDLSPKELATLKDTRELGLGPVRIADGVAISRDGFFSAALQVGTVNFALATAEEQESIIGGYHAVLRQLSGSQYQIKVRVVEADLEPLAQRVDYALSGYNSPALHRLALHYKQFLREELPNRLALMERRNYVIAGVHSPLLVTMAQVYEQATSRPCPIFSGLGPQWRNQEYLENGLIKGTYPKNIIKRIKDQKGQKARKLGTLNPVDFRKEQLARARVQAEMEGKMYQEFERILRQLKHELSVLITGLSSNGLAVHRLNDWELTALYAEYLRPELAEEVRHSLSAETRTRLRNSRPTEPLSEGTWFSSPARPLSLAEFMGEQSGTVVVSELAANSPAYRSGALRTNQAIEQLKSGVEAPVAGNSLVRSGNPSGPGTVSGNTRPVPVQPKEGQLKITGPVPQPARPPVVSKEPAPFIKSSTEASSSGEEGTDKSPRQGSNLIQISANLPVKALTALSPVEPPELPSISLQRSRIPGRPHPAGLNTTTPNEQRRLET